MEPLASGRDCDIFDLGDGTVLRRQRDGRSLAAEAAVLRHVAGHGFPCPALHRVDGPDMVLDLVEGPTMTQDVLADPSDERARAAGVLLADLHRRLHEVPPLGDQGGALLHLDLHPDNIIISATGPVVIDRTNAEDGPAELDLAMTWVILEPFAAILSPARKLLDAFLDSAGRDDARGALPEAVTRRLADGNATDEERAAVRSLLAREHGP